MQVIVSYTAEDRLNKFFGWLKKRATDPIHIDNRDLIADFVEKVLVVELKRTAEAEHKTFEESIEVPDEVFVEPLKKIKAQFDQTFQEFLTDKGLEKALESTPANQAPAEPTDQGLPSERTPEEQEVLRQRRNGNGHKSTMTRKLNDTEKDQIRAEFIALNGQVHEDACVQVHKNLPDSNDVGIFQVVGFVSYLHFQVARGKIILRDLTAYEEFLQKKYARLWPKYQQVKQNPAVVPKLTPRPRRGSSS
jgi:hypothetical protein